MVKYKIGYNMCYTPFADTIYLHTVGNSYKLLSDNEYINFVADSITHEFIHSIIYKIFNLTVSKLFDGISYLFYQHYEYLKRNKLLLIGSMNWKDVIDKYGFSTFCQYYKITQADLVFARLSAKHRCLQD